MLSFFFFSSRRRHTRCSRDWSSDVCSSDLGERTANTSTTFAPAVESFVDNDGKKYHCRVALPGIDPKEVQIQALGNTLTIDRKSTRLNSSHGYISYAVFCLKKKKHNHLTVVI